MRMRLGETGLSIHELDEKVSDEIIRDDTGMIYYSNRADQLISLDRDQRRNLLINEITDMFNLKYIPLYTKIYSYYEKAMRLNTNMNIMEEIDTIRIDNTLARKYRAIFIPDIICINEDGSVISDIAYDRLREMNVTFTQDVADITLKIRTFDMVEIPLTDDSLDVDITTFSISNEFINPDEYLIGFYIVFMGDSVSLSK